MAGWFEQWRETGPGVLVRRHRVLDLTIGLVLGDERCLLVDTHAHDGYARELLAAVAQVTSLPLVVLNTHAHFDHCFGNATVAAQQGDVEIWGHERCRADLLETGELQRRSAAAWMSEAGADRAADAAAVEAVTLLPPHRTFTTDVDVDLGGRVVTFEHPGLGHTDHDAVVHVPDAGVSLVGDLVEEGAPPAFEDAHPLAWPLTLRALLPRLGAVVVPGHGDVVDAEFVAGQAAQLERVAVAARRLPADADDARLLAEAVRLPLGRHAGLVALRRAQFLRS